MINVNPKGSALVVFGLLHIAVGYFRQLSPNQLLIYGLLLILLGIIVGIITR